MILGLIEHDRGVLNNSSLEMLDSTRSLASNSGSNFLPVLIGEESQPVVKELQAFGIEEVYLIKHPKLDDFAPDAWAESLVQLVKELSPQALMAVGTDRGNEVLARVAARMALPFAANCVSIEFGDTCTLTRNRWGGSLHEEATLKAETKLFTLAEHSSLSEESASDTEPKLTIFEPELSDSDFKVRVIRRIDPESGVSLGDAPVVIGGGRGVGSAEGFVVLEELAALVEGAIGGSRVVTNLGWRPHSSQIGQTGTRIAPDLYIACGISGATQHWVGCMGSKVVLSINTDPEAPIVAKSDYAVIGDMHEIVPAVIEELKKG